MQIQLTRSNWVSLIGVTMNNSSASASNPRTTPKTRIIVLILNESFKLGVTIHEGL